MDRLCNRFMGLNPFDILNAPTEEVFEIYVDCIIHDSKQKKNGKQPNNKNEEVEWVTSKNATWH